MRRETFTHGEKVGAVFSFTQKPALVTDGGELSVQKIFYMGNSKQWRRDPEGQAALLVLLWLDGQMAHFIRTLALGASYS